MDSKQHKQALSNLQNKIGDKDVNHFMGDPRVSSSQLKSCAGDQLIAKRRAEKFKRIKCSTLANLLRQNGSVEESIY